ncbi:MAG TPA: IS256 family transposase [Terriglobales bacterium]|nr:IS256 family transposase [Terriglobales bacterium]
MTRKKDKRSSQEIKALMSQEEDFLRPLIKMAVEEVLEAEMEEALGASKSERSAQRQGYRSGYYQRKLITRVGVLELRVPQDRQGRFSTEVFERYQRSEKALVGALVEMYVQGVSTRKVKAISEELCGHEFSASTVSQLNKKLDEELARFARRKLKEEYPYVIVDARYEKVREGGVVQSRAVLVAIGIDWEGRRRVIGVELANRESTTSWKEFLLGLKERGLHGVRFVVSDQHEGLRRAVSEVLSEATWQRCYVHFLRNALDYLPRKNVDDCLLELRWLYDRRDVNEARADLQGWLEKWNGKYPKLCSWVEENIEATWTFYRLPREHHKHMKSTNMLERLNQEIKRRTHVIRIFPNEASCLRLIRALASERDDEWFDGACYLNMEALREQSKIQFPLAA